ncbi:hypothetical protein [Streptomyces sp. enrichment culture]|uniref:hypothetical protein n=1 Tax=Streptomyces sp. enrichment culture TaxID=1795815 RepID=UPI003F5449B0
MEKVAEAPGAPFGETLLPSHAQHIVTAYRRGERDRARMAGNLLEPARPAMGPALRDHQEELSRFR